MAILQLPYNLSALFNFNEPDTNEGAMESSDEDFFDLFDFLPENTVTTNYLAKGEDRIQSLLRIKTRRTYSMNDFFKLFSRDQFWKKSNSRKDFTEYLIKTYWKKVIDPFVNTLYKDFWPVRSRNRRFLKNCRRFWDLAFLYRNAMMSR